MSEDLKPCGECGMLCAPGEFHPYAACLMFRGCNHNGDIVRANLSALAGQQGEARPAREEPAKMAPVQGWPQGIPWSLHLEAYAAYCKKWGPQPAMIDLEGRNCRGGFGMGELDGFIPGWRDRVSEIATLRAENEKLRAAASGERDTLRALLREAREYVVGHRPPMHCVDEHIVVNTMIRRIDAALADGGATHE